MDQVPAGDSGTTASSRDALEDFSRSQGDRIKVDIESAVGTPGLPDPFEFVGQSTFNDERQVRFVQQGGRTVVQVNLTGNDGTELTIQIEGLVNLQASDFVLG